MYGKFIKNIYSMAYIYDIAYYERSDWDASQKEFQNIDPI